MRKEGGKPQGGFRLGPREVPPSNKTPGFHLGLKGGPPPGKLR